MKCFLPLLCIAFLSFAGAAVAAEPLLRAQVIDTDPKGTNMRDAPKGKVVYTIPLKPKDEMERVVNVHEQQGEWFRVTTDADAPHGGWMHSSVLGLMGGATEDGPCPLMKTPSEKGGTVIKPKEGAVLQLLGITGAGNDAWFKVRYTDAKGVKHDGWVPRQCE